jgi:hypothetical protein
VGPNLIIAVGPNVVDKTNLIRYGTIPAAEATATVHTTQLFYDPTGRVTMTVAPNPDTAGSPRPTHSYAYASDLSWATVSVAGTPQPNG